MQELRITTTDDKLIKQLLEITRKSEAKYTIDMYTTHNPDNEKPQTLCEYIEPTNLF